MHSTRSPWGPWWSWGPWRRPWRWPKSWPRSWKRPGNVRDLTEVRSAQAWALQVRGEHAAAAALGQWIAKRAREYGSPEMLASAYPPAAVVRVAHGDGPGAIALLAELSDPHVARTQAYAANLAGCPHGAGGGRTRPGRRAGRRSPAPVPAGAACGGHRPGPAGRAARSARRSGGPVRRRRRPLAAVRGAMGTSPGTARPRPLPARTPCASRGPAAADRSPGHLRLPRRRACPGRRRPAAGTSDRAGRIAEPGHGG